MSQPTFAVAVVFDIKSEFVDRFRERVLQQAKDSVEKEPGCYQFDVLADQSNPTTFFLYETYLDAEAFNAHKQTSHFADFDSTVTSWVASKEVRRLRMLSQGAAV
jgi:(4S)-4-hydroxy-5-phosphonooxypentane-2,3-dione isomerase